MEKKEKTEPAPDLATDIVYGIAGIAEVINRTERQTEHLIARKAIPFGKLGGKIVSTRSKLRKAIDDLVE